MFRPTSVRRVRKRLEDAGLELHAYDPKKEGDRERAFKDATEGDGVKFSKRSESMFKNVDSGELKAINTRFNEELQQQIYGKFKGIPVYQLGNPSEALLHAGFEDLPSEVTSKTLDLKSSPNYKSDHPFSLDMVMNLPKAIQSPIAVFDSEQEDGRKVVLTEMKNAEGKTFLR